MNAIINWVKTNFLDEPKMKYNSGTNMRNMFIDMNLFWEFCKRKFIRICIFLYLPGSTWLSCLIQADFLRVHKKRDQLPNQKGQSRIVAVNILKYDTQKLKNNKRHILPIGFIYGKLKQVTR